MFYLVQEGRSIKSKFMGMLVHDGTGSKESHEENKQTGQEWSGSRVVLGKLGKVVRSNAEFYVKVFECWSKELR